MLKHIALHTLLSYLKSQRYVLQGKTRAHTIHFLAQHRAKRGQKEAKHSGNKKETEFNDRYARFTFLFASLELILAQICSSLQSLALTKSSPKMQGQPDLTP